MESVRRPREAACSALSTVGAIALVVSLLECRAVFTLVFLAGAVAIVIIVIAFAISLSSDRIVTVAVPRVVSTLLQPVAISILRSRRYERGAWSDDDARSEEHTAELHSPDLISYAVF